MILSVKLSKATKNLIVYLPLQFLIWIVYYMWTGINWYTNYVVTISHLLKYFLFELLPSTIISILIILVFKLLIKSNLKPLGLAIIFIISSLLYALIWPPLHYYLYIALWEVEKGSLLTIETVLRTFNNYIFIFLSLNATPYIQYFFFKYKVEKKNIEELQEKEESKLRTKLKYDDKIYISNKYLPNFILISSIAAICADGSYSYIYTSNNRKIIITKTLKKWEELLPQENFFRIHHSTIVNINQIDKIEELENNTYKVFLYDMKQSFEMSRRFGKLYKERFKV